MQRLVAGIILCVCCALPKVLTAQHLDQNIPQREAYRYGQKRISFGEEMIRERALYRARQREARIQTRKWLGISSLRPQVWTGHHAIDLNEHIWYPYPGAYERMWLYMPRR